MKRIFYSAAAIIILILLGIYLQKHLVGDDLTPALNNTVQNATAYLNPVTANKPLLSSAQEQKFSAEFLQHYFEPWAANPFYLTIDYQRSINSLADAKQYELTQIEKYRQNPGWGMNRHRNSPAWITQIADNMNMPAFATHMQKAILIHNASLRVLPTNDPSFDYWKRAGEGYPFDYLQDSWVAANTPALVLQTSKDGAWDLILTSDSLDWTQSQNVALANNAFIKNWQTGRYVAVIQDKASIYTTDHQFHFMGRLGAVYPINTSDHTNNPHNDFHIMLAAADMQRDAIIISAWVNNKQAVNFPLPLTQHAVALLANNLLGAPYGWGGMLGYRDCSLTMVDLFAPFGIWLPRNSGQQALQGTQIKLESLSATEKLKIITAQGVAFVTLLHLPGHVVLYLGQKSGQAYVFQDVWGLPTKTLFTEGRAVIGATVITPITLGKGFINIPKTLLDKIISMNVLT